MSLEIMTAVEQYCNNNSEKEFFEDFNDQFNQTCKDMIDQARVHLMLREFPECLELCTHGLEECSRHSLNRGNCCYEGFVILAVQAYGEQNKWRDVLPFIDRVYGEVRKCPPTIIKLCIGLLSWVKEYELAQKQASLWLDELQNNRDPRQHADVGKLLLEKVLFPQKKYSEISHFIERLPGMTNEEREQIHKLVGKAKRSEERRKIEKLTKTKTHIDKQVQQNFMLSMIQKMKTFLQSLSPLMRHSAGKVIFFGLSLYLVFLHLRVGDTVLGMRDISRWLLQMYSHQFKS